jgi:GNAT superfamily N-acetyltransferase
MKPSYYYFVDGTRIEKRNDVSTTSKIPFEEQRGPFRLSSQKKDLDISFIQHWLNSQSYWAKDRSADVVGESIENSFCIGLYDEKRQIGFARVVTDYATFAWLCDVFIIEEYRGQGLGKWLIEAITADPDLRKLRMFLGTRDAHGLYERYGGFERITETDRWMTRPGD